MKGGVLAAVVIALFAPVAAYAMGGFEYYDQTPASAWDKTMRALLGAVGPVFGKFEPGRGAGAEDTPKRYVTRRFSITLPPGWAARPRDNEYNDVVFYPRDKRIDILIEVTCVEGDLDLRGFSARYAKWLDAKGRGYGSYVLISRENTLQDNLPCCIMASGFEMGGKRLFQVVKMLEKGGRILVVKCVADGATWTSNYQAFREILESLAAAQGDGIASY